MYVKIIEGTVNISNMPEKEAIAAGYKLAVRGEKPEPKPGYHAVNNWTEEEDTCTEHWSYAKDVYDDIITSDDAIEILLGGAS